MAVRVLNRFHTPKARSPKTHASVIAVLAWKLALDAINRMRQADYDIDIGQPYFDFIVEFTVFLAHAADRIAHRTLDNDARTEFTTALAIRLSEIVADNHEILLGAATADECRRRFIDIFNQRGADYSEYDYGLNGPSFGFKRIFAAALADILPAKDKLWAIDQAMDIEAPIAIQALEKALKGLFVPSEIQAPSQPPATDPTP